MVLIFLSEPEFENVSLLCGEPSCVIEANFNVAELKDGNATVVNGTLEIIGSVAGLEVDPERDNFTAILGEYLEIIGRRVYSIDLQF